MKKELNSHWSIPHFIISIQRKIKFPLECTSFPKIDFENIIKFPSVYTSFRKFMFDGKIKFPLVYTPFHKFLLSGNVKFPLECTSFHNLCQVVMLSSHWSIPHSVFFSIQVNFFSGLYKLLPTTFQLFSHESYEERRNKQIF